jgi:phage gp29-like protein
MAEVLFDAQGNAIKLPKQGRAPKGFEQPIKVKDRVYRTEIYGITPDLLWSAINSAYTGDTSPIQCLFEQALAHDGHLHNLDQRRRGAVAGLEFVIRPYMEKPAYGEGPKEPEKADIELCNFVADVFNRIPNIQEHMKSILDAIGKGFSVLQINWVEDRDVLRPFLRSLPQRKFTFQRMDSEEILTDEWPNILTDEELTYGEELDPLRNLVAIYRDRNTEAWRCGVMWSCMWFYLRKHEAWAQAMATGERFAEPTPVGYVGTQDWNSDVPQTVQDAIENLGPGSGVIMPGTGAALIDNDGDSKGAFLDFLEAKLNIPKDYHRQTRDDCDKEMSKAWNGGNLLTDTSGGTGTYNAREGQAESERDYIIKPDCDWLTTGPIERFIELIVYFNKGAEACDRLPTMSFPGLEPADDIKAKAEMYEIIGKTNWDAIRSIPPEIREELDLPEMAEPEEPEEEPPGPLPSEGPPAVPEGEEGPEGTPEPTEEETPPEEEPEATVEERASRIVLGKACSCNEFQAAVPITKDANDLLTITSELLAKANPINKASAEDVRDRVTAHLLRLKNPPKSPKAFQKAVLREIDKSYATFAPEMERAGLKKWFDETYKHYKTTDRSVWPGKNAPASALTFGAKDQRLINEMNRGAKFFFSQYTDNDTFREPMTKFLTKTYAEDGAMLFKRNPKVVKAFGKTLGETTKKLADHEIDRIARTSVARAREQARIMQMSDAGVASATVVTHPDACPICQPYEGKTINVADEVQWIDHMSTLDGDEWKAEAKKHTKQAIKGVPPHEFSDGGGAPLYHPNCRCSVEMVVD